MGSTTACVGSFWWLWVCFAAAVLCATATVASVLVIRSQFVVDIDCAVQGTDAVATFRDVDSESDADRNSESGDDAANDLLLGDDESHTADATDADGSVIDGDGSDLDLTELSDDDTGDDDTSDDTGDDRLAARTQSRPRSRRRRQFTLPIDQRSVVLQAELKALEVFMTAPLVLRRYVCMCLRRIVNCFCSTLARVIAITYKSFFVPSLWSAQAVVQGGAGHSTGHNTVRPALSRLLLPSPRSPSGVAGTPAGCGAV